MTKRLRLIATVTTMIIRHTEQLDHERRPPLVSQGLGELGSAWKGFYVSGGYLYEEHCDSTLL